VHENLIHFFRSRLDVFPLRRDVDLHRLLEDGIDRPWTTLPIPAKIFLVDELAPYSYGFPVTSTPVLNELEAKLEKWITAEIGARTGDAPQSRCEETLSSYRSMLVRLARNALESSILADYHAVFWLVHSQQLARLFSALPRRAMADAPALTRDDADVLKYHAWARWQHAVRDALPEIATGTRFTTGAADERSERFVQLLLDNPLITAEEGVGPEMRELRSYFTGHLRRDVTPLRKWLDELRASATHLIAHDRLFRRAMLLLGYPETAPTFVALLDRRVQELVFDHPSGPKPSPEQGFFMSITRRVLEYLIVWHLRRGIVWMRTTADGENVSEDDAQSIAYSRAIRPMNFGRRGIVEPIVYRYGLVYDITSFTQTLGEIARGGKEEEQSSYRQMLTFQRELAEITSRNGLQFEKFLGDGAFYTSRRATRTIQAAVAIQDFYAERRRAGFAFNKGMRIALNYGYYRLLPMQVSLDGTEIKEFYGPGIVELSRLTTGKATKEIEDIQHLLLSHGYDQMEVYRFFAPLARGDRGADKSAERREFYAYVNENGHLVNEGIVASIPFLKELTAELMEDQQRIYRLRTPWDHYLGFPATDSDAYIGVRLLGSVSLKGIGNMEVAEIVRLTTHDADVSLVDDPRPLLQLLQMERNRSAARSVASDVTDIAAADLVVCESRGAGEPVILVGEWDPVAEEVRRPIQLGEQDAERYGLAVPLSVETVEQQSESYQKLYRKLCGLDALPSFPVQAIKDNANFSGFIIGETVERL
jgi:hypothetical protein